MVVVRDTHAHTRTKTFFFYCGRCRWWRCWCLRWRLYTRRPCHAHRRYAKVTKNDDVASADAGDRWWWSLVIVRCRSSVMYWFDGNGCYWWRRPTMGFGFYDDTDTTLYRLIGRHNGDAIEARRGRKIEERMRMGEIEATLDCKCQQLRWRKGAYTHTHSHTHTHTKRRRRRWRWAEDEARQQRWQWRELSLSLSLSRTLVRIQNVSVPLQRAGNSSTSIMNSPTLRVSPWRHGGYNRICGRSLLTIIIGSRARKDLFTKMIDLKWKNIQVKETIARVCVYVCMWPVLSEANKYKKGKS